MYRAINALKKAKKKIEKMNSKYPELYKTELDEVGKSIIARWYSTYDPIYYHRTRSLYHAYKIYLNGTKLVVDFDKAYMDEYIDRQYNEWIYVNSFENGYHGGGIPKEPGYGNFPYWRTPYPELTEWGRPALMSFSPFNRMWIEMKKTADKITKQKQDEYDKAVAPAIRALEKIL